jgi:hypothetical protein
MRHTIPTSGGCRTSARTVRTRRLTTCLSRGTPRRPKRASGGAHQGLRLELLCHICVTRRFRGVRLAVSSLLRACVMASRPVGGILSSASRRLCDHPSVRPTSGLPLPRERRTGRPYPTFGLAPGGVCRATRVTPGAGALLPHRFTLACARRTGPSAVCSLWHFPAGRPDWPLASTLPCGVPTFLSPVARGPRTAVTRPTHHHPRSLPSAAPGTRTGPARERDRVHCSMRGRRVRRPQPLM